MSKDKQLAFESNDSSKKNTNVEDFEFEPIKGYPMLNWKGKRPFTETKYFPAQLKEAFGSVTGDEWRNKIYWGDNLQVMSHLLKSYRGKINLIYIDPPFDSKAEYKKTIELKKIKIQGDYNSFEEKQYSDIWTDDMYLQFMYDRIVLMRELLSDDGSLFVHVDSSKGHYIKILLDEIFGVHNFRNEIIWGYSGGSAVKTYYPKKHDNIFWYSKSDKWTFNQQHRPYSEKTLERGLTAIKGDYELNDQGAALMSYWTDKQVEKILSPTAYENVKYPTQKPESLLDRIIKGHSNEGDIIFDCFSGSGTTAVSAWKNNRKFIVSDINLGAIETLKKRMLSTELNKNDLEYNFEIYSVNNYELFRNAVEAKEILLKAFEVEKLNRSIYDGEKDGRMVKIMPVNRIASKSDLSDLISGFDYKLFEKRQKDSPNKAVEKILLVCMGHEADLKAHLVKEVNYKLDIEIVDILRDKQDLQFKRESEAKIKIKNDKLVIEKFYPMNLLQKLSLQKEKVVDWRELVESVLVDWNYDGAVFEPKLIDYPERKEVVKGEYDVPESAGTIRVKITDLLSESIEAEVKRD